MKSFSDTNKGDLFQDDIAAHHKMTEEEFEQLKKDSAPMWLTNKMIQRPCLIIFICYVLLFAMAGIAAQAGYFE
jgi:hypothetical protein